MKIAGVVAEFNPFHTGHAYLLEQIRKAGFTHIAVVMSGNYTQRGEAAIALKGARAKMAVAAGADLILELPTPFAVSSAEKFAFGAVFLLDALHCVDSLCFGSECGDITRLRDCADRLRALDGAVALKSELARGVSFARARAAALEALGGAAADVLSSPNDTLGVEYLKALRRLSSPMHPFAVTRAGARHDGAPAQIGTAPSASASAVRRLLREGAAVRALTYLPEPARVILQGELDAKRAPFDCAHAGALTLDRLRRMSPAELATLPDVGEGLENRIFAAVRAARSFDELLMGVKSKRYALSRLRRILLCAYLGIDRSYTAAPPPYLRPLCMNARGAEILRRAKETAALPVVSRHADFEALNAASRRLYALECLATDLYGLCAPSPLPCGLEQRAGLILQTV